MNQASSHSLASRGSFEAGRRDDIFHRVIGQLTGGDYKNVSLVDIACGYNFILEPSVRAGASYLGVEAREENIERGNKRISADLRDRARIVQDLCQNVDSSKYGTFDIVLLAGIIYHLSPADNYRVLKNVRRMFRKGLLIDTASTQHEDPPPVLRYYLINGVIYGGVANIEHEATVTRNQMETRLRASYTSDAGYVSFLLQRHCLNRMLRHLGFAGVFEYLYYGAFNDVALNFEFDRLQLIGKFRRNIRQLFVVPQPAQFEETGGPFIDLPVRERDGSLASTALDQVYDTVLRILREARGDYYAAVDDLALTIPVQLYPILVTAALVARSGDLENDFRFLKVYLDPCIRHAGNQTREEALALLCAVLRKHKTETELAAVTTRSFVACFAEFCRVSPVDRLTSAEARKAVLEQYPTSSLRWQRALAHWPG